MGKPNTMLSRVTALFIAWSEPGEVKHFSTQRKKEQLFIPLVAASEKGGVQTHFLFIKNGGCKRMTSGATSRENI